jgi:hypothetical protein
MATDVMSVRARAQEQREIERKQFREAASIQSKKLSALDTTDYSTRQLIIRRLNQLKAQADWAGYLTLLKSLNLRKPPRWLTSRL